MNRIEVRRAKNTEYYLCIVANNTQVLLVSETYVSKSNALRAANRLLELGLYANIVDMEVEALKRLTNLFR